MNAIFLLAVASVLQPAVEVQPLSGDAVQGRVVALDPQSVTLETPKGRVTLEIGKLAGLIVKNDQAEPPRNPPQGKVAVELVDGAVVQAAGYTSKSGKAAVQPLAQGGTPWEIATQDIRWVRLQPATEALSKQWAKILESESPSDLLVVRKDDALDYHKGVIKNVTDEAVEFELDGETLPVKRAKVYGLVYHHPAGRELPDAVCTIYDTAGSSWPARSLTLSGATMEWSTPAGVKVTRPAADVARIDFSQGKIVYLSDIKPDSVEWTPYFSLGKELAVRTEFYAPRRDRSMSGGPLELEGKTYKKGVAMHSRTVAVYRLPGKFSRFKATLGIDDRVRPRGHVQLVIHGDDKVLFDGPVAGNEPARPIDLDVTGVRRLSVLVDFGNDMDIADHLDFCDARFVK